MQEITYERKIGDETFFAKVIPKLDQYGKLMAFWKTSTLQNQYVPDGWYYATDVRMTSAGEVVIGCYSLKIAGKKVDAVRVTDATVAQQIIALNLSLHEARKERIEQYKRDLRAGTGKIRIVKVGCDWVHLAVYPEQKFEDEVGFHAAYQAIADALKIEVGTVVSDEVKTGEYTVAELQTVAPKLYAQIRRNMDAYAAVQNAAKAEEEYLKKTGKTFVKVHHCLECGTYQILGGKSGRLEKSVWWNAVQELRAVQQQKYEEQSSGGKVLLASVNMADDTSKLFDLETEHFVYRIVSEDMDSHGC